MTALAKLEETIAKLERAAEDCRAVTREAHEATKELRRAEKAVRDLLGTEIRDLVDAAIAEQIRVGLEGYAGEIRKATDAAIDRVGRTFEELARIYLVGKRGEKSIPELVDARLKTIRDLRRPLDDDELS